MSIRNIFFLLKLVWSVAPARLLLAAGERCLSFSFGAFYTLAFFRHFLNTAQAGGSFTSVVGFFVLFMAFDEATSLLRAYFRHSYCPRVDPLIRGRIALRLGEHALNVEYSAYEDSAFFDSASAASRNAADDALRMVEHFSEFVACVFALALNMGFATWVDPGVLLIALPSVALMFILQRRQNQAREIYEEQCVRPRREADYARRTVFLREYAEDQRATEIWRQISARFERAGARLISLAREHGPRLAILRFGCEFATQIWMFVALNAYIAWRFLNRGAIQLGDYASLQGAAVNFMHFVAMIAQQWISMGRIGITAGFVRGFFDLPVESDEAALDDARGSPVFRGELVLERVSFRYSGANRDTLTDITLRLKPGERLALVGENGAGKSTLVKVLLRLHPPSSGRVAMDGRDARDISLTNWRSRFATSYQDYQIYAATLAQNVLMRPFEDCDEALIWRALEGCGLAEKALTLPLGIHTPLTREFEERGIGLSGGEAQRVALARVLASNAPIAIMDEPSAALDPMGEYSFFEALTRGFAGRSVVFVSHRLSSATLADRILFMENGSIIEQGSHAELMKLNGKYALMFRVQARNYLVQAEGGAN